MGDLRSSVIAPLHPSAKGLTIEVSKFNRECPSLALGVFVLKTFHCTYQSKECMNQNQRTAKAALQSELLKHRGISNPLTDGGNSREGYAFTEVERVTVCFGPDGGIILPSVRSYGDPLQAAVYADIEFKKNRAGTHKTGHDGGIVGNDWYCDSSRCDCRQGEGETYERRFERSVKR